MWIDKADVRYVIHYDLPSNIEDYTQEIGRAWRDWKISRNIIFYNKKEVDKRVKQLNFDWLKYFHMLNFLKNMYLSDNKKKYILTPRQIASKSWIKTDKKNWTTSVKNLLNFLEQQKIGWINILSRKYDRTGVLFNKIEKKILLDSYKLIEKDWYLDEEEKKIAKEVIYKIVEQKKALDLNNLEENFSESLWEKFDFKKVNVRKIVKKIESLKILSKSKNNKEADISIEAWNVLKDESFRKNIFNIYRKRVWKIENFKESNEKCSFYEKIKNYYLFRNYIRKAVKSYSER